MDSAGEEGKDRQLFCISGSAVQPGRMDQWEIYGTEKTASYFRIRYHPYLQTGKNLITLKLMRWSDGTT